MMQASWNGVVIAESGATVVVEGNHYFPIDSVRQERLSSSDTRTTCGWKGEASYFDVVVDGEVNVDAAWVYPDPKDAAENIRGLVAFWKGITVTEV